MVKPYDLLLKSKNLSLTAIRLSLLEVIESKPHTDASYIFELVKQQIPAVTIQAIYNNLNSLTQAKIIREIKPKGYPSIYEINHHNHHHIICRDCRKIVDTDNLEISSPLLNPNNNFGFIIDEIEIIFWGLCPDCSNLNNEYRKND